MIIIRQTHKALPLLLQRRQNGRNRTAVFRFQMIHLVKTFFHLVKSLLVELRLLHIICQLTVKII